MSFSKDAKTGVYRACNQAFAEYAHKESPEGVVGLTDAEIFDAETARHFTEDDHMAISMEKPYVFFEDVPDAAGNRKQFRTTKLKYTDDAGRLCILGMCEDITDMVRIQQENASAKEAYEKARSSGLIYTRIAQTLARGYTDLYYVNLDTEEYIEYRTDDRSGMLQEARRGEDFFDECRIEIAQLKAAMVKEKEGLRLIVGVIDIDAQVRQEEEYGKRLAQAQTKANVDALTGVRNRHAYLDAEEQLDRQIAEHSAPEFAICILDVNDLKKINDSKGHQAGDQYLRDACRIVCNIFKHSPVFRVGGDEFAVISRGEDYENMEELLRRIDDQNREAARNGGIVIACGMSRYADDGSVAPVFERADQNMYENKSLLKDRIEVKDKE